MNVADLCTAAVVQSTSTSWWWAADAPTWLAAVATTGALIAAAYAAKKAADVLGVERARDAKRAEVEDAEKARQAAAHAERFAAWAEAGPPVPEGGYSSSDLGPPLDYMWRVHLRNAGDLPVYRVRITWYTGDAELGGQRVPSDLIPPNNDPQTLDAPAHIVQKWVDDWEQQGGIRYVAPVDRVTVAIEFVDASGRRWRRDQHGILTGPIDN